MKVFLKSTAVFLAVFLLGASLCAQPTAEGEDPQMKKEFQQRTEKWRQAYNSKDAQQLAPLYTTDAVYLSSHVEGLVAQGREQLIAYFQGGMDGGGHMDSIEVISVAMSCDLATLHCRYQATNSGVTVVGRNLLVLRRVQGAWLISTHMTVVN